MPFEDQENIDDSQKQYWKEYSQKNRQKLNEKEKLRRKRLKEWLKSYKNDLSCSQCDESENHCLDFHHVKDKKFTINYMVNNSYSTSRIEEEIEKCIVLCSNCHRIQHYGTQMRNELKLVKGLQKNGKTGNKRRKRLQIAIYKIKSHLSCYVCIFSHARVIDFHHVLKKLYGINDMVHRNLSKDRIITEIKKCIPLCANCHRKIHNDIIEINISDLQLEQYWKQFKDFLELKLSE